MNKIILERRKGEYGMEAKDEAGHLIQTDTSLANGGTDFGFRPMQLMLVALGSCSAIDLVSILNKQRQKIDGFSVEINGEREKDVVPSLWKSVSVTFHLTGEIDSDKAKKAAALSMEKYCSVAETLRRSGTSISWAIKVTTP